MLIRNLNIFFSTLILLIIVGLAAMNWHSVHVLFLGHVRTVPLGPLILLCTAFGCLATMFLSAILGKNPVQEAKRLSAWQSQDAKLAAQVKSDREKQLEAKIATLESALKTALKK